MAVQRLELDEVEARRRAADGVEAERVDHLLRREHLLVAMSPTQAHEVVPQRFRQESHGAVGLDAERAMAFRQLRAVGPVDERDVRHHRHLPAHRRVDLRLARGVGEMVVAADDVGDAHVVVVDDHRQHVGRRAVGAQQHEVVEIAVRPGDAALHLVVDHGLALGRRLEAHDRRDARGRLGGVAVAPASVVAHRALLGLGALAHRREFILAGEAMIRLALGEQSQRHLAVTVGAGELVHRLAVPIEAEPGEAVDDRGDRGVGRALAVGVLDAQEHLAAVTTGEEPVEERGTRAADVEEARGRGREARDDLIGHRRARLSCLGPCLGSRPFGRGLGPTV